MNIKEAFTYGWNQPDDALRGRYMSSAAMDAFYLGGGLRGLRDCVVGCTSFDSKVRKEAWQSALESARETFVDFPREILAEHRGKLMQGLQLIGKLIRERGAK